MILPPGRPSGRSGVWIRGDRRLRRRAAALGSVAALGLLAACGAKPSGQKGGANAAVTVGYVVVQPTRIPMTNELSGRVGAYQSSDVRPQVSGLIEKRLFVEGSRVTRGQPLYEIDPSLYRAAVNQAQANVQSAQANLAAAQALADRYRPLAAIEAVSQQDYANAAAAAGQAKAAVAQTQAALDTARINLKFTTVPAPISGQIGRSLYTVGALVTTSQANPLATIQQLDPMFVDLQQSSGELLALRRSLASGGLSPGSAAVRLTLEDGSAYDQVGTVEFSEAVVDPSTGTVTLRARIANPRGVLLPGMFVRASFVQSVDAAAFLVPQPAVSRDPKGQATVYLVGPGDKAVQRTVTASRTQGAFWVVTQGLGPGDKVITQGLANVLPNKPLRPVPASAPERIQPPSGHGHGAPGKGPAAGGG
ncbi:efflux transporter periplasmic adaptor subunit [Phenylobacterium hankyongense]|uniref:Efflux transporter periplasmic adaptor subunit n=1 Tax=Phenylobacterium hankyongense TaxID=1813876 RepID=A0A328AUP5_9CAUL|nr:efflux transporter periplasmic adaptor subunit [Phenylobacterium hankyongense]